MALLGFELPQSLSSLTYESVLPLVVECEVRGRDRREDPGTPGRLQPAGAGWSGRRRRPHRDRSGFLVRAVAAQARDDPDIRQRVGAGRRPGPRVALARPDRRG